MAIHAVSIIAILFSCVLIFSLPRNYIIVPILTAGIMIPASERIIVVGFDFNSVRMLIFCGWLRLFFGSKLNSIELNKTDKAVLLFLLAMVVTYTTLRQTYAAFINRIGFAYTILGIYF